MLPAEFRNMTSRPVKFRNMTCHPAKFRNMTCCPVEIRNMTCHPAEFSNMTCHPVEFRNMTCHPVEFRNMTCHLSNLISYPSAVQQCQHDVTTDSGGEAPTPWLGPVWPGHTTPHVVKSSDCSIYFVKE